MITHVRRCWILRSEILSSSFEQKTFTRHLLVSFYNSTFDLKYLANQRWSSNPSLACGVPLLIIMPGSDHGVPVVQASPSRATPLFRIIAFQVEPLSLSLSPPISLSPSLVCSLIWRRNLTAPYRCQRWRGSGRFVLTTTTVTLMRLCPRGSALFVA